MLCHNNISKISHSFSENQTPPTIQLKENVYKVRENEDVTFTVPFTGAPTPDAEWFTSGTVVKPGPRKQKTLGEDSASLTIRKVADEDAGEYTIKLTNPVGDVQAALTLVIMSEYLVKFIFHLFQILMRYFEISQNHHLHLVNQNHWKWQVIR